MCASDAATQRDADYCSLLLLLLQVPDAPRPPPRRRPIKHWRPQTDTMMQRHIGTVSPAGAAQDISTRRNRLSSS